MYPQAEDKLFIKYKMIIEAPSDSFSYKENL